MNRRTFVKTAGVAGSTCLMGCLEDDIQEEFPVDDLTWMIPGSNGCVSDRYARQIAPGMSDHLDVAVDIENRPGGRGMSGSEWLVQQPNDGYTFGTANSPRMEFNWMISDIDDWHPGDFEPVSYGGFFGYTLIVNNEAAATAGIADFGDLREAFSAGTISGFGYQGAGSVSHLTTILLREDYGLDFDIAVPYEGDIPTTEAVMHGEVAAGIATNTAAIAAEESSLSTAIVNLMDVNISDALPGIDSITNYGESLAWIAEFGQYQVTPPGTDQKHREILADGVAAGITSSSAREWAVETGNVMVFGDTDEAEERLTGIADDLDQRVTEAIGGFDALSSDAEDVD